MEKFTFDENKSSKDNIESFLKHTETINPKLSKILRDNLNDFLPLPEIGPKRNKIRQAINQKILGAIINASNDKV